MNANCKKDISLVVCSCDKYKSAWLPYFELLKKYWKTHPENVYLISETQTYSCEDVNIISCPCGENTTWSERLIKTLSQIESKYIIFMLEDFFLLGNVKQEKIDECYDWMEKNPKIAGIRLWAQNSDKLSPLEPYGDFYSADKDKQLRVDAQAFLWRRETFLSFLDPKDDPWHFESNASKRSAETDNIILWHYMKDDGDPLDRIIPYDFRIVRGYGITWGYWLWNNKKWFEENGIKVDYKDFGILSEKTVMRRIRFLYKPNRSRYEKFVGFFLKIGVKFRFAAHIGPKGTINKIKRIVNSKRKK